MNGHNFNQMYGVDYSFVNQFGSLSIGGGRSTTNATNNNWLDVSRPAALGDGVNVCIKKELDTVVQTFLQMNATNLTEDIFEDQSPFFEALAKNFNYIDRSYLARNAKLPSRFNVADYVRFMRPMIMLNGWAQAKDDYALFERNPEEVKKFASYSFAFVDKIGTDLVATDLVDITLKGMDDIVNKTDERWKINNNLAILEVNGEQCLVYVTYSTVNKNMNRWRVGFLLNGTGYIHYGDDNLAADNSAVLSSFKQSDQKGGDRIWCSVKMPAAAFTKMEDYLPYAEVTLKPFHYLLSALRMLETLQVLALRKNTFFRSIVEPTLGTCKLLKSRSDYLELHREEDYNERQQEAILTCLNTVSQPKTTPKIQLIQGPPGTGKTHTLVGILKNLFDRFGSPMLGSFRVLVCAPSNGAIDNVAYRIMLEGKQFQQILGRPIQLIRLGMKEKVDPNVLPIHTSARQPFSVDTMNTIDIIFSTLGSSHNYALDGFRVASGGQAKIDVVIVDESAQCSEPEVLLPMIYDVNHLILIGDHMQLPATILSTMAEKKNYGRSLFERFTVHLKGIRNLCILTLEEQFRMQEPIVAWPSKQFYDGRLTTRHGSGLNAMVKMKPYFVFDLHNTKESESKKSRVNRDEVTFIKELIAAIHSQCGLPCPPSEGRRKSKSKKNGNNDKDKWAVEEEDEDVKNVEKSNLLSIGIITFYSEQKKLLNDKLPEYEHCDVLIETVDGFQGREMDIIIVSCVRTEAVGFVSSKQRTNVALTRAKSSMFVCLNGQVFENDDTWSELIKDARVRGHLKTVNYNLDSKSIRAMIGQDVTTIATTTAPQNNGFLINFD